MFQIALSAALAVALSTSAVALAAAPFPDPAEPTASAPGSKYDSAFTGYRPYDEAPPVDWRALNAEVGAIGGHVGMFRGSAKGAPPAGKPSAPAAHAH